MRFNIQTNKPHPIAGVRLKFAPSVLELHASLHAVSAGVAEIVSGAQHDATLAAAACSWARLSLHLLVKLNVFFRLNFPVSKIVVVVCHIGFD